MISFLNELVRTPAAGLDDAITRVLGRMGDLCKADRAYVFVFRDNSTMDNTHEWVAKGIDPMREHLQNQPLSIIAAWQSVLAADGMVHIPCVKDLPDDTPEKPTLDMQGILSVLVVPILVDGQLVGLAGLDRTRKAAAFSDEHIAILRGVADVIQSALMRKDALQDLERTRDKLELTLAALPDLLIEVDFDGVYRTCHHAREVSFQPPPPEVIGKRLKDILRPEVAAARRRMMADVLAGKIVTGVEQLLRPDDPASWVEVSVSLRDTTGPGDPGGYLFLIRDISERKAREAELAKAYSDLNQAFAERDTVTSRLQDLSSISNDWVWELDAEGRFTYVSPNITLHGVDESYFLGHSRIKLAEVSGIDTDSGGFALITDRMNARKPFRDILYKARRPDGSPVSLRISGSPMFDNDGVFKGYRGVGSDVTEISKREETALDTTRRFEAIMAALPDLLFEIDDTGHYTGFQAGPAHLRLPVANDVTGKALEEVLPPEVAKTGRLALQQVLDHGRVSGLRYPLDIDGERHFFEISGARKDLTQPDGKPSAIFLVRDVTDDTLRRDELLKMGKIVEAMTNFVVVLDREERVVWFNRAFAEKSGWALDEVRGQLFEPLVRCADSDPATASALRRALERREPFRGETVNKDRHGNRYWIDFNVQPLIGIDGELQGFVTVETDITEHKRQRAEVNRLAAEAMETRQRLENALDALPDSVVICDSQDRLVIANKAYRQMFPAVEPHLVEGQTLENILRAGLEAGVLLDSGPGKDIEAVLAERLRVYAQPKFEDEVQLPDGRWVRRIHVRTSDGGCITVAIDVTARRNQITALDAANMELKNALAERDRVEEQLATVMEGAAIGIWEWNAKTQQLTVGGQWRQILGYDEEQMPPLDIKSFRKLVHPDDLHAFDTIGDVAEDNATALTETEFRMLHSAGHWEWVLSRSQITKFSPDGRPEIIGGVHLNISERKRLEQGLEQGKTFLEQVMDASIAAIVVMDGNGTIIYANTEAERILQLSRDALTQLTYNAPSWRSTKLDGSAISDDELPFALAMAEKRPVRDVRFAIEWADGTRRSLSVNALVFEGEGDSVQVVTSFNDITDELATTSRLEQARMEAEEASRSKSMFLANMSHEIRTPLNGVLGMAEVLEGTLIEDRQRRMIGTIRSSGETLLSILNDILDMSKIEAGKMEIEQVAFVVDDLVQPVQALNAIRAEEKGLELRVHTNSGCALPLMGDPHRISQILNNLLHNAIKFTDHGSVKLTLHYQPGDPLEMVVQDTGMGMSKAQVDRILDSFEQADGSITRRFGGTGLGMSIVRQLVTLMQGEIAVQSTPDQGTTIRVTLPLAAADTTNPHPPQEQDSLKQADIDLSHLRALVADDSPTNRLVLSEMLRDSGLDIVMVENGRESVDQWADSLARGKAFDIILLDISMPVMDGVTALTEIRAQEAAKGIAPVPVIAVTANAMPHQVADYLIAGFDTHLAKPFKRAELLHAIVTLTRHQP
ncbi:MAG: PAS domain S-box protein [Rhodobacterales bacterium]